MLVIHSTKKLLSRLPPGIETIVPPPSTTKLGDWFGHPVGTKHRRLILLVSENTRLPVLIDAKETKSSLVSRLRKTVGAVIPWLDDIPRHFKKAEFDEMQDVVFAKTASQSVLGSIKDYTFFVRDILYEAPDADLIKIVLPWLMRPWGIP